MIRNRFKELCAFLKNKKASLKLQDEQFDAEVENMTVEDGGHNETVNGVHFCNFRYQGVLYIERLPESAFPMLESPHQTACCGLRLMTYPNRI